MNRVTTPTPWVRLLSIAAGLALLLASAPAAPEGPAGQQRAPNVLFVLIDDLGARDLPIYGHTFHETPNIDRLAAQGMLFTDAYAAAPVCSPARAAIQSGQYPARLGITEILPGFWRPYEKLTVPRNRTQHLPLEVFTIGEALKERGYTTGYFGKWHLGEQEDGLGPERQGYDSVLVHSGGGHFGPKILSPTPDVPEDAYLSEVLTDRSIRFMAAHRDRPFFLMLSHYAVHTPLQAEKELIQKYERKPKPEDGVANPVYAAMVEHVDDSIGRLMEALDELGLAGNTVVVLFSDNGGLVQRFDRDGVVITTNAPFRAEKGTLYEGGIRVPLIVRWPGVAEPGSASDTPVTGADFFPTFLEMAGGAAPTGRPIDGASLVPLLEGQIGDSRRPLFFHYPHYHHAVPAGAVRQGPYKLVEPFDGSTAELYNLELDPGEQIDLSSRLPARTRELQGALARWRLSVGAEMPVPNPSYDPSRSAEWGEHPDRQRRRKRAR